MMSYKIQAGSLHHSLAVFKVPLKLPLNDKEPSDLTVEFIPTKKDFKGDITIKPATRLYIPQEVGIILGELNRMNQISE